MKTRLYKLLRWSEKYTKTDMVYLTKGGFWLVLGHGIQVASGFVLAIAFANLLPKTAYGTYQFIMAIAAILSTFTLSGMGVAVKRAVAKGAEGAMRYGFQTQLVWSTGIVLASGALSLYYFLNGNTVLGQAFLIVGAFSPFIEGFSVFKSYLIGKQKFRESAFLGFWRRPLFIVTMLTALFLTDDPVILVFVYFASSALSAGLLYLLVVRKYNLPLTPDPEIKNYSKHLSVMGIVGAVANNIDKVLIWTMLGATPVAIYALASLPLTHLLKLFGLGGELVFPRFAQRDYSTIRSKILSKIFVYLLMICPVVIAFILLAPYIYQTLFPQYPEAVVLSQILIIALLAKPAALFTQVFAAHKMKRAQYMTQFATVLIRTSLLILGIMFYGLQGAVYALVLSSMVWALTVAWLFYTHESIIVEPRLVK